jgi:hypothetical protein
MTHKSLLAAAAAASLLALSSGAQACHTNRAFRHVGDGIARTSDCLFGWMFHKRA